MKIDVPSPYYCDGCKMVDLEKEDLDAYDLATGKFTAMISYKCANENLCAYRHDKWFKENTSSEKPAPKRRSK